MVKNITREARRVRFKEITELNKISINSQAKIFIAYNRRFYSSVYKAKAVREDGVLLLNFNLLN